MVEWVLARLGYAVLDLDAVARALAGRLLADYEATSLDQLGTMNYLRTRYMRLVADYGLPADCCSDVAGRAWSIVARAKGDDVGSEPAFKFYDD